MGIFFDKPTKGPDAVGGMWPIKDRARLWNRCGAAREKGHLVQLALQPGEATEIATNDVNSYIPGMSNDTVWNTFIDPISNLANGSSIQRGGVFAVVLDDVISDNKAGWVETFGNIAEAYVVGTVQPGDPLCPTITNSLAFPVQVTNTVIATYISPSATLSTKTKKRVFFHQGIFAPHRPPAALT